MDLYWCTSCGKRCIPLTIDFEIVSDCCHSDVSEDEPGELAVKPPEVTVEDWKHFVTWLEGQGYSVDDEDSWKEFWSCWSTAWKIRGEQRDD